MTIAEAQSTYGCRLYTPSVGLTICNILDIIYGSRKDVYYYVLQRLNHRTDWDGIIDTTPIRYFSAAVCNEISEIQDETES